MLILGLDPGSRHTGYGLVHSRGGQLEAVANGRLSLDPRQPLVERLARLQEGIEELIATWSPQAAVLESLFHGINPRSLIVLAQARGAILAELGRREIPVAEYTPAEIKGALTGNGRAEKRQVARMVQLLLQVSVENLSADQTDALAVAICYAQRYRMDALSGRSG